MTAIREARHDDIPTLLEMGRRFFDATSYGEIAEYDPASVEKMMRHLIDDENGVLLVAGDEIVGAAGALFYPFHFNLSHKTGQEIFWWVDVDCRGVGIRLFRALEVAAKSKGAVSFSMSEIGGMKPARAMYERAGYMHSDSTYIKRL